MNYNNDFKHDLEVGQVGEQLLGSILSSKTIEVKRDSWICKSGNIAIEYESRGKPSGIATSEATYWAIIFSGEYNDEMILIIEIERLKKIARQYFLKGKTKAMGDNNTSKAVLIPIKELMVIKNPSL